MKKVMSVIVMTSSTCNLDCSYCYMRASRQNEGALKEEDLEPIIKNCSKGFDSVQFHWHGGEPLLSGKSFYEEVLRVQRELPSVTFLNRIQTNGVLLTPELADFFASHNFHVGISIDAPEDIYPLHRGVDICHALKALSLLKERNVSTGVLCVVSKLNVSRVREIFEFYKSIGIGSFGLLPLKEVPLESMPLVPSEDELTNLFKEMFDLWMYEENCFNHIDPIGTMVEGIISGVPRHCSFAASCLGKMITVDQNGNAVPCASLVSPEFILGSLKERPLIEILASKEAESLRKRRANAIAKNCSGCEFVSICNGGCRAEAYWHTGNYEGITPLCGVRKSLFPYIRKVIEEKIMPQLK